MHRGSKLVGVKEASSPPHDADVPEDFSSADDSTDEPPIIVELLSLRVRMRSERPLSSVSDNHISYYQSSHSTTRLSDIPTRLSGWFQHTFDSSATDLSLPRLTNSANLEFPQDQVCNIGRRQARQGPTRQGNALPPRQRFHPRQMH
jgi:cysteine protease ATG4